MVFGPYYVQDVEVTTFTTNRTVFLLGFFCVPLRIYEEDTNNYEDMDETLTTEFDIIEIRGENDEMVIYNGKVELESEDETYIVLNKPVVICPGLTYKIRMNQSPPENCCTRYFLKSEIHAMPDVTFQIENGKTHGEGLILSFHIYIV